MIAINIIDYLAVSFDVPEISSEVSEITVTTDFGIKINNYCEIISYDQDIVVIKLKKDIVTFNGNNLNITYINDKFIMLSGDISAINFEECD